MSDKEAIKQLFILIKDYKWKIVAILLCLLLSAGLGFCLPILSSVIMDKGFIGGNYSILIGTAILAFGIYMSNSLLELLKEKIRLCIFTDLKYSLEKRAFNHLMKMKIGYFHDKNHAEILNNLRMDINQVASIAEDHVFFVFTQLFSMVGGIVGLFILDYRMTLLILFFLPIKYIVMKSFAKTRKEYMESYLQDSQNYYSWYGDVVDGVREVKLFGIYEGKYAEFREKQEKLIEQEKRMSMLDQRNNMADSLLIQFMITLIYIMGANLVFKMQLSVGKVFAFITYSVYVTAPISAILNIGYYIAGIIPSTKRYYEFLSLEEEYSVGKVGRVSLELSGENVGSIDFNNVTFSYDRSRNALRDITFSVPQYSKTALIGANGSGKSTVLDLLLRIYEPDSGQILLNGCDIRKIPIEIYRNMFSVVGQNIYLFHDSIRNNITLYKVVSDEEIYNVCRKSGLGDFVDQVSLDYNVGQNGAMLSGGQKQKIALARALMHDKPIIIFDEVTSAADSFSERQISTLFHTEFANKTVLVVTHHIDAISDINQMIQLNDGSMVSSSVNL